MTTEELKSPLFEAAQFIPFDVNDVYLTVGGRLSREQDKWMSFCGR